MATNNYVLGQLLGQSKNYATFGSNMATIIWSNWIVSSTTQTVWYDWMSSTNQLGPRLAVAEWVRASQSQTQDRRPTQPPLTAETEARLAAESLERDAAEAKAAELLEENLPEPEVARFRKHKVVYITSEHRRRYRLAHDGATYLVEDGHRKASFCIHPETTFPRSDVLLAKVLMLRCNETEFLRIANRTEIRSPLADNEVQLTA